MPDLQATEKGRLETKHKVHASEIEAVEGRLAERVQEVEELRRQLQVGGLASRCRWRECTQGHALSQLLSLGILDAQSAVCLVLSSSPRLAKTVPKRLRPRVRS